MLLRVFALRTRARLHDVREELSPRARRAGALLPERIERRVRVPPDGIGLVRVRGGAVRGDGKSAFGNVEEPLNPRAVVLNRNVRMGSSLRAA